MLPLAADENFDGDVLEGLRRRVSALDVVRVQDTELRGAPDPDLLAWAARERRVLLTHDRATLTGYAYERVAAGPAIDELELIVVAGRESDVAGCVLFLPL